MGIITKYASCTCFAMFICSKLPDAVAGVAEQVNKEVNKSLAERGFPAMRPEQQQLLKGQICAIIESDNAIYKLMSQWQFISLFLLCAKIAVKHQLLSNLKSRLESTNSVFTRCTYISFVCLTVTVYMWKLLRSLML